MEILITESQFKKIENIINEQNDLCLSDFEETVNGALEGVVQLNADEIYSAYEFPVELSSEISDPNMKNIFTKIVKNLSSMGFDELKNELSKVLSWKKSVNEQQTPYLDQTLDIAGVPVSKPLVHSILGLIIITILSKLINMIANKMDSVKSSRRKGRGSSVVGCQGSRARAQAVRKRRRRENWKRFLNKIGLR
jgi:hypothetical protein